MMDTTEMCAQKCPEFKRIDDLIKKVDGNKGLWNYWKIRADEYKRKCARLEANNKATMVELKHLRVKLRDIEGSDKLITGLVTPLCLFGSLMVILVTCVCIFQNTEVCKKAARRTEDQKLSTDYGDSCKPSYMKPPTFYSDSKSKAPSYSFNDCTSIRKEKYNPGSHAPDNSSSLHPFVTCPPSLFSPDNASNIKALSQYLQVPVTAPPHEVHYSQQPSQRLLEGHIVTFPSERCNIKNDSEGNGNSVMGVNQFGARSSSAQQDERQQQTVTKEARAIGVKEQARKDKKNSCAFRLADLDFAPEHRPWNVIAISTARSKNELNSLG